MTRLASETTCYTNENKTREVNIVHGVSHWQITGVLHVNTRAVSCPRDSTHPLFVMSSVVGRVEVILRTWKLAYTLYHRKYQKLRESRHKILVVTLRGRFLCSTDWPIRECGPFQKLNFSESWIIQQLILYNNNWRGKETDDHVSMSVAVFSLKMHMF